MILASTTTFVQSTLHTIHDLRTHSPSKRHCIVFAHYSITMNAYESCAATWNVLSEIHPIWQAH